jgi:hypothetical protein
MYCWKLGFTASLVFGGLLSITGCGSGNPVATGVDRETRVRLNILATFYDNYLIDHRGKPPKDVASFREFLQTRGEDIRAYKERKLIDSVEELLTSARDDKPFSIVTDKTIEVSDSPGVFWAAYEQEGADGQRMAAQTYSGVNLLDSEAFAREFPEN